MQIIIDIASKDEALVVRALRWLLKRMGRDYGLRCTGVRFGA